MTNIIIGIIIGIIMGIIVGITGSYAGVGSSNIIGKQIKESKDYVDDNQITIKDY